MARDYRKLRVFAAADALAVAVYEATRAFPAEERYGLQAQIRRAAVSIPTNIVEGSARRSEAEYLNFLAIANGSAHEVRYLLDFSRRLGYLGGAEFSEVAATSELVAAGLGALLRSLKPQPPEA
jgi:four helix bundle protein